MPAWGWLPADASAISWRYDFANIIRRRVSLFTRHVDKRLLHYRIGREAVMYFLKRAMPYIDIIVVDRQGKFHTNADRDELMIAITRILDMRAAIACRREWHTAAYDSFSQLFAKMCFVSYAFWYLLFTQEIIKLCSSTWFRAIFMRMTIYHFMTQDDALIERYFHFETMMKDYSHHDFHAHYASTHFQPDAAE